MTKYVCWLHKMILEVFKLGKATSELILTQDERHGHPCEHDKCKQDADHILFYD